MSTNKHTENDRPATLADIDALRRTIALNTALIFIVLSGLSLLVVVSAS